MNSEGSDREHLSAHDKYRVAVPTGPEAEEIVRALGSGEIDAVLVQGDQQDRVLALVNHEEVQELSDVIRAIRQGEVDAFVVNDGGEDRIYTLAHMEQALRDSEAGHRKTLEHLKLALDASGAVPWEWHSGREDLEWSPEHRELYGLAPHEPSTFTVWRSRIHPDDIDPLMARISKPLPPSHGRWHEEFRIIHPAKGLRWISATGLATLGPDGRAQSIRGILLDITDKKAMEEELVQRRRNLEDQVRERTAELETTHRRLVLSERMAAVGTLAAGLAHDMSNVILPLSMRIDDLLANPKFDREAKTDLAVVTALLSHLRQMSRNLTLFSRDPKQEGSEGSTDLSQWCDQVKGLLDASVSPPTNRDDVASGNWIRLKWDIPQGLPPVGVAPHRLTQAVLNLVHNARDAIRVSRNVSPIQGDLGQRHGTISIQARPTEDGNAVSLQVSDNGCGMDETTRHRCVEPFFTTKDRPRSPGEGGSGMGMSLAYAITERIGGRMEVASEVGKGTTVTITLPSWRKGATTASSQ